MLSTWASLWLLRLLCDFKLGYKLSWLELQLKLKVLSVVAILLLLRRGIADVVGRDRRVILLLTVNQDEWRVHLLCVFF